MKKKELCLSKIPNKLLANVGIIVVQSSHRNDVENREKEGDREKRYLLMIDWAVFSSQRKNRTDLEQFKRKYSFQRAIT